MGKYTNIVVDEASARAAIEYLTRGAKSRGVKLGLIFGTTLDKDAIIDAKIDRDNIHGMTAAVLNALANAWAKVLFTGELESDHDAEIAAAIIGTDQIIKGGMDGAREDLKKILDMFDGGDEDEAD